MGANSDGKGSNKAFNKCGIPESHAYSILAVFSMTDGAGEEHKCLLMRDPFGTSQYNQTWSMDDPNWTESLISQVPWGVDVRTQQASEGLFTVPISLFIGNDCFGEYLIGHNREADGYADRWYDAENDDGEMKTYFYYPQRNVVTDLYFSVESYNEGIVPIACTQGTLSDGQFVLFPVVYFAVYKGTRMLVDNYYVDQYHRPILMTAAKNRFARQYTIYV